MQSRFGCKKCDRIDVADHSAAAVMMCHGPMDLLGPLFPARRDPDTLDVALIKTKWSVPPGDCEGWKDVREVWFLKPGRQDGERIGWIGKGLLGWKYLMVAGIAETKRRGMAIRKSGAIESMLTELDK